MSPNTTPIAPSVSAQKPPRDVRAPPGAWDAGPVAWVGFSALVDGARGAPASWGVSPAMRILRVADGAPVPSKRRAFRLIPRPLQSRGRDSVSTVAHAHL